MIGWEEIYKVITAMVPLYIPMILGYSSVKWWHTFNAQQCTTINTLSCYYIFPFFNFDFITQVNIYKMNYHFIFADIISKCLIGVVLALWANLSGNGNLSWCITMFSLSTVNNTLVIGVSLLQSMYSQMGADISVQSFVMQSLLWLPALLFMLELWSRRQRASVEISGDEEDGRMGVNGSQTMSFWRLMRIVTIKVVMNPNCLACIASIIWTLVANRWHLQMPSIVEGSITIISRCGGGIAMFNIGLFMGLQENILACGTNLTLFGMLLRFFVGPTTLTIGGLIMGMRGDLLSITIIQAGLPQSITTFLYAKEYGLHANVISTSVAFGTIVSLPVLIAFYAIMEVLN